MRVIGGEFRSRRLKAVRGREVRPTSDRLRETLFDVLGEAVAGRTFADVYAGSGAVGIEALSRGAAHAIFIESNRQAAAVLRENLRALDLEARARVIEKPAAIALRGICADLVFLDPPYARIEEYEEILTLLGQSPPPLVIAEHSKHAPLQESYGELGLFRELRQGDSCLSFYRR